MSGRAPSTNVAGAVGVSCGASPATGSRRIRTAVTTSSSSAQPVTGMDPLRPAALLAGVSKAPNGAADVPFGYTDRVTLTDPGAFDAPVAVTRIAPVALPDVGTPAAYLTPIVSAAEPVPDAGETVSQG